MKQTRKPSYKMVYKGNKNKPKVYVQKTCYFGKRKTKRLKQVIYLG